MKHRIHGLAAAGLAMAAATSAQSSNPGEVLYEQKISSTQGGFTGVLDANDELSAVAALGDLDGDGVTDLAVGAPLDDDGGSNRGAVWILFLDRDGTVNGEQKISDTAGAFSGVLDDGDQFGATVAHIGDLDGNDVADIAVHAPGDDDGGTDRGAVWILFLNTDGTVAGHQKISDTAGGFTGTLDDGDGFGTPSAIDDLDGDTVPDLAAGAPLDDDGGTDRGAVWILFLNPDGTVASHAKISATTGGLVGPLANGDSFGASLASLGDLDGGGGSARALAVGASQDDQAGLDAGAMWVLYVSSSGVVSAESKISEGLGGFTGNLDPGDGFGVSVANLGPLSGVGSLDLAVGAQLDDDGAADAGAVWVLSLDSTASVLAEQKVGATQGNFLGGLGAGDRFGARLAGLGDLDLDGRTDLASGAPQDDDGATNAGAVYVLFLNDGTLPLGTGTTRWTGAISRAWTNAGNWTNGVPSSTKSAVIPDVANDPLVSDNLQACLGLLLLTGAVLELNGQFGVHAGGTIHGSVIGTGELRFQGAGVLSGRGTISVKTVFNQDVTVQGGVATSFMDVDITAGADVTVVGDMSLLDLGLEGTLDVASDLAVDGDFQGGTLSSLAAGSITFGGDIEHGGALSSSNKVVINEPSAATLTVDVTNPIPEGLDIDVGGRVVLESSLTVQGDLTVLDGTLAAGTDTSLTLDALVIESGASLETETFAVSLPLAPTVTVRGELSVEPDGELRLSAGPVSIESGGKLRVEDAMVRGFGGGGYALSVGAGATLEAFRFTFRDMGIGGVFVHRDALLGAKPFDLRMGLFTRAKPGGVLLHIERAAPARLMQLVFEDPQGVAANNVRTALGSAPIGLQYWSGRFSGPVFEDDPLGKPGILDWGSTKVKK